MTNKIIIICLISISIFSYAHITQAENKEQKITTLPSPLDLNHAQKIAITNNPDLQVTISRLEQAKAQVKQVEARWLPSLDLSLSANRNFLSDAAYEQAKAINQPMDDIERYQDSYSTALQLTWLLFDGWQRKFRQEQAAYNKEGLAQAHNNKKRVLKSAVAEAFFNVQLAQSNLEIARQDKKFYQKQLDDVKSKLNAGVATRGEMLNITVQLNDAKRTVKQQEKQVDIARYGLAWLLALPSTYKAEDIKLAKLTYQPESESINTNPQNLIKTALEQRADLLQLQLMLKAAAADISAVKGELYPKVQLFGQISSQQEDQFNLNQDEFGAMAGININWNIFSGGASQAMIEENQHKERELRYQLLSLQNQIINEIKQNLAQLEMAREQIAILQENVAIAEENRNIAQAEYEAGETTLTRLNEAQLSLNKTRSLMAASVIEYYRAKEKLKESVGESADL